MTDKNKTGLNGQGSDQPMKKQTCNCGRTEHYEDANYCVKCGAKLK